MPPHKKTPPTSAAPVTSLERIQHLRALARSLDDITRDAHAATKSAQEQFSANVAGLADPLATPHKKR